MKLYAYRLTRFRPGEKYPTSKVIWFDADQEEVEEDMVAINDPNVERVFLGAVEVEE